MNIFLRVLLAIYAFFMAILSIVVMVVSISSSTFDLINTYMNNYIYGLDMTPRIIMFAIALIFFILSILFLFSGVRRNKDKKGISRNTDIGEIKISLETIQNITENTIRRINGIRDSKITVKSKDNSVLIVLKLVVQQDLILPALTEEVQNSVKSRVEEISGVQVREIKVLVENIAEGNYAIAVKPDMIQSDISRSE